MKTLKTILFSVLAVLAIPSFAAWTIVSDGSNPQVTDGNWVIQLNSKYKAKFVSKADGGSTVLDMSTLNSDLAAAGHSYKCTEFDANGFRGSSYDILKTGLTEIYFPDEVTKIGQQCFQNCNALAIVELGRSFSSFANTHGFSQCHSLVTLYTRGEEKVVGTIKLPDVVTTLPNYTFENCKSYTNMIARGVKKIGQATFYQNGAVCSIELSPELYSVTSGSDNGTMYQSWNLTNFYPSVMALTDNVGNSSFRELPLKHGLDFSESTFTSVAKNSFYGIKLPNDKKIILPATLTSVGAGAFRQQQNGKTLYVNLRFLGEVPVTLGTDCFTPKEQKTHNVLYVDAKKCTSWTAQKFTPLTEDMKSEASYPGEKTLGKSTIGVDQSGWWNWLVQEDLPKGPTEWNVVSENNDGSITIYNKVDTWTFNLIPDGNGAYLVKYVSDELAADATVELELVKISDDLEIEIAGLADEAFKGVTKISKLVLPVGADYMGDYALENCTNLKELILSSGFNYNEAGKGAFKGCSSLSIVGLSTQSITAGVVVLPDSVTSITEELFAGCTSIKQVTGNGVATIGANAFVNASALARVAFSKDLGALTFGEGSFMGTALTQTIDLTLTPMTKIPANAFANCSGISLVIVPASVTEIGANAFANMAGGANISFAGSVPTLGANALMPSSGAAGSRYVIRVEDEYKASWQENNFTAITDSMMEESDYYSNFYVGQTTAGTDGTANWMFCKDPSKTWWISGVGTYTRPDNNQKLSTQTVTDGTYIMHVVKDGGKLYLAPSVCVAGGVLDMSTLDVDTGLEPVALHTKAFYKFENTPAVVRLPDSMTSIGYQAFLDNKKIVEVELGAGITSLGDSPFRECEAFSTMYQRGTAERIEGQVNIPAIVTSISIGAEFYNCDGIKEVIAPGVVVVGHSTFYHCSNVTNIVLSSALYEFKAGGNGAFYQCKSLKTISPNEMKLVATGSGTFRELRLSHGLDLSKSTFTYVGDKAFYATKCTDENGFACPMVMPKTVTKLDGQAFWGQDKSGNQIIVFKGNKPTSVQTTSLDTQNNGLNTLVVDAETYPDWLDSSEFTPVSELPEADVEKINLQLNSNPNYPGIKVLGKLSTGTDGKYLNWLAQLGHPGTVIVVR